MFVNVVLIRKHGVPIASGQLSTQRVYSGRLRVRELPVPELLRTSRVAELMNVEVPELYDVTLLGTHENGFTLTGFERVRDGRGQRVDYAQSWYVRLAAPAAR